MNLTQVQALIQSGTLQLLTSVAGTNTITATATGPIAAYAAGQMFLMVPANTNTGATTVNINGLGAKNIFFGGVACVGGELTQNVPAQIVYDGTQFQIISTTAYNRVRANTGHIVLPGNIVVNWARLAFVAATGPVTTSWSKAFGSTPYVAVNGRTLNANAHVDLSTFNTTTIGATLSTAATGDVYVIAIGPA